MFKIKVGKIQVNQSLNPKDFLFIGYFAFLLFLLFSGFFLSEFLKTKDYVKIDAVVTKIDSKTSSSADDSVSYYADLDYKYNGQNYHYRKTLRTFILRPKVNSKIKIYIDPISPSRVRDTGLIGICIVASLFFLLFFIVMIKCYFVRKEEQN